MSLRSRSLALVSLGISALQISAQTPKLPAVLDPALKIEALATYPEVEACATVCGAPDGSFYVGCDTRDASFNTVEPECFIVRYSSMSADRKRTIFADKIYSPAGSAWFDGWLYVSHNPFLTRFKDTDGDGVADVREDLITNLGKQPDPGLNDHLASGFTLGMDGFFYMSIGDRGTYQTKSVKDGSTITMQGGGIIRFRPDGAALEVFSTGTRNHLAVLLDAEDNAFTLDNTDDGNGWWTRLTHHIEGGYYGYPYDYQKAPNYGVAQPSTQTLDSMKRNGHESLNSQPSTLNFLPAMADFGGGSPTGGLCYLSDGLPETYRGKLIFSEWGKRGLFVIEVARDGATFRFVKNTPLVQSAKDADFRPLEISVANDGSLLIADWGYGGWKGPKRVGAVWRLSWPEAKPAPRLADESKASVEELIAALGHPDRDQRLRAQGEISRRDIGVTNSLASVITDPSAEKVTRLHALRAFYAIGKRLDLETDDRTKETNLRNEQVQGVRRLWRQSTLKLIEDADVSLRCAALRSSCYPRTDFGSYQESDDELRLQKQLGVAIQPRLSDTDASVRREAVRACLGDVSFFNQSTHQPMLDLMVDPDLFVRFTASQIAPLEVESDLFDPVLARADSPLYISAWSYLQNIQHRAFGSRDDKYLLSLLSKLGKVSSADTRARATATLALIAYKPTPWDGHWFGTQPVKNPPPLNSVAWEGTAKAIEALTAALADADSGVRLAAAKACSQFREGEAPSEPKLPAGADGKNGLGRSLALPSVLPALRARLTAEAEPAVRRQLIESLGVQKDTQAMDTFRQIALDEKADAEFRDTAINAVVNIGGDAAKKTIAQLASAKLSPADTRKVIQAAGELRVIEAAAALIAHLSDEDAGNRESAAKALARLGPKSGATDGLIAALLDRDAKVQTAAVEALGVFKDKRALPALLDFAKTARKSRELIAAIAAMPDAQALPFLVDALREKGGGERRVALDALKKTRAESWPLIEQALAAGRIPAEYEPEIRAAFESGAIAKWKMIGPFENVWGAVHPPEKDALALFAQVNADRKMVDELLARRYVNAEGKEAGWIDVTGDADGHVNLAQVFHNNGMVCAYAFTEIESTAETDARLLCGSDDQIAVWLNGVKVHDSGVVSRSFGEDQDQARLHFVAGRNALLVKIGNLGSAWEFAVRIPGLEGGRFAPAKELAPDEKQRAFALATKPDGSWLNAGDAKRGEKLYFDQTAALGGICATCHAVRGKGGAIGPDLSAIAVNYRRPELVVSILEPSKTIALGFEQSIVETKAGETLVGALRQETNETLTLIGADGQPHVVKKADVKSRKPLELSLMPPGLTLALKPADFADLLAFLETLK